jgi:hypothetical protein
MATEKIGPIGNRVLMNLLDRSFKSGSINSKEYRDLKKEYFGKPKLIQMDLFPNDPKKKQKGGLMEQTNGLKKMGLKKGGQARGRKNKSKRGAKEKMEKLTPQERKELLDKINKSKGKMTNPFIKLDMFGRPTMEAKKGGLAQATAKLKAQGLKKGGFPDLSGDGKVTMKDVLMGRGVIKKPKKKASGGAVDTPRKKRGNYGPNIGKPFKAMGPVGGLPVNKSGTKIMSNLAGRLAKRGYGAAKK